MFTNLNIMYLYLKISLVFDNHCFLNNVNIKDFLPAVWKPMENTMCENWFPDQFWASFAVQCTEQEVMCLYVIDFVYMWT